ncbi:conserved hypothetical lipoprotein [Chloroherpeton thalassium ATCC 35110]|uniref:Conserved hypothetical lipoprotein n=1 Tax=Chloroherpeton thalassium (strain ATCC 35110 / GB-78) TaxID=517418 RepID=B3QXH5_CHLT3|nr:hypothetical protein [Chloroherpeton thalassium]ACF13449.1 conserved hypothetical lipoprotein [Chloroherpeton thalassium ATCC 35110]
MKHSILLLILALLFITTACDDDDDAGEASTGEILITTSIPNSDGTSGSAYMQLINDMTTATYTNSTAYQISYSGVPIVIDEDVFVLPGMGDSDYLVKYTRDESHQLVEEAQLSLPASAGAYCLVKESDEKAYVSFYSRAVIWIINPTTLEYIDEIDISSYAVGDQNPDASVMVLRDGYLYVALNQTLGGYFPSESRPYSDVLIIDTSTDEVVKMISETTSSISTPGRPVDQGTIFVDENNDIYLIGLGGWGYVTGHKTGILRIKSGETEFDDSYLFNVSDTDIDGEDNATDYISNVQYAGDGKLYANLHIPAYSTDGSAYFDKATISAVINLESKTVTALDFPKSNEFANASIYNDLIIFGLITDSDNGFFTYDPLTGEASSEAVITTTGYPQYFFHFGETYN